MATDSSTPTLGEFISLVDNTEPSNELGQYSTRNTLDDRPSITQRLTRSSIREEFSRRKYAKWQADRLGPGDGPSHSQHGRAPSRSPSRTSVVIAGSIEGVNQETDAQSANLATLSTIPTQRNDGRLGEQQPVLSELDVLYENQRGWFSCGIPYYSPRSLLPIDPPAWVNRNYKPSAVDITNAQVPDPSWQWLWKSWYVDMSNDVDEEGWQYSFSFGGKFGWHGTHTWFHSYVRRRLWVRLRGKIESSTTRGNSRRIGSAHHLNEDYFTIHSNREPSVDVNLYTPTRIVSSTSPAPPPKEILFEDIEDIPTLMQALRIAMVDRERIEVLKRFISQGGEELCYLEEKVSEIMSFFVFHTTRWQFLKVLETELDSANIKHMDETQENQMAEKDRKDRERRRDNLAKAAEAVRQLVTGEEVFDLASEGHLLSSHLTSTGNLNTGIGSSQLGEIRGIPKEAEIDQEAHIY